MATSLLCAFGGLAVLAVEPRAASRRAPRFEPGAIRLAWTDRRIRHAYLGYFGHMWELYAMWAWVGAAAAASYAMRMARPTAESLGKLTAFLAIGLGAPSSACRAGWMGDRTGKANVTILAMAASGARRC